MPSIYDDSPSLEPGLDFTLFAEELCKLAKEAVHKDHDGSFTIGIFGSWGSGKTTLMKAIEKEFKKYPQEDYKTVWFNPWKYDDKEVIWNALIQTIFSEVSNQELINQPKSKQPNKQDSPTQEQASNATKTASMMRDCWIASRNLLLSDVSTTKDLVTDVSERTIKNYTREQWGFETEYAQARLKRYWQEINKDLNLTLNHQENQNEDSIEFDPFLFINRFEESFKNFIDKYVGEGKLIILVDDLDRCLPENALTVLEALKLYLDKSNCIFILGLDKRIIEQAVQQKYHSCTGITGREYVEKIIQLNFFLPEKDTEAVEKLLQSELTTSFAKDSGVWRMIHEATDSNVRKVRQFIIAFKLLSNIGRRSGRYKAENALVNEFEKKLARILLMQLNFPELFESIKQDYEILENFQEACNLYNNRNDRDKMDELNNLLNKEQLVRHFWENRLSKNFMIYGTTCAKIESREELIGLLRLVSYSVESN